jgi:hypothetical protein
LLIEFNFFPHTRFTCTDFKDKHFFAQISAVFISYFISVLRHILEANRQSLNFNLCVLSFEEVKISESIAYNARSDQILGPHKQAQVAMIRGLLYPYKQPVYIKFDQAMKKDIVFEVMCCLEKIVYKVVGMVSDMATSKVGLWRSLGITDQTPFFFNPRSLEEKVFMFPDAPHLLKLCRNHYLDKGYVLPSGELLKREDLEKVLSLDCAEFRIVPKLKEKHFVCYGSERQRVSLAAQLMSNHSATALKIISPDKKKQAEFIKLVNDWFDVANSRRKYDENELKSGFGLSNLQLIVVNKMIETMSQTKQLGSKKLLPFQHGIIMWCHAIKGLYNYVQEKYKVGWIMTNRVNQDHLENYFSQIRGLGRANDNPGPVEFLNRTRLLMIGHSEATATFSIEKAPVQFPNISEEDANGHFMSVSLTATVRSEPIDIVSESVPDELFEPFELETDENNNSPDTDFEIDCSEQGLIYIAGWLAFKFRHELRHLGNPTGDIPISDLSPWLAHLSRGGLLCPTDDFVSQVKVYERHFQEFHGDRFSIQKNVIKCLYSKLCDMFPDVYQPLLLKYVPTRTFFRIRFENDKLTQAKREKTKKSRNLRKIQHFTS